MGAREPHRGDQFVDAGGTAALLRQPRKAPRHADPGVRLAAFEDGNGPHLAPGDASGARARSVVVDRIEPNEAWRSAQLPSSGAGTDSAGQPGTTTDDSAAGRGAAKPLHRNAGAAVDGANRRRKASTSRRRRWARSSNRQVEQPEPEPITLPTPEFQPNIPTVETARRASARRRAHAPRSETLQAEEKKSRGGLYARSGKPARKTVNTAQPDDLGYRRGRLGFPFECSIDDGTWHAGRCWEQTTYLWKASALCHKPLFFEDEQLERYGHSYTPCFQPIISGAHFFTRLPILPYCMGVEPPCECIYALGHYRPGNCAPYMCNPIPLSPRGARSKRARCGRGGDTAVMRKLLAVSC